MCDSVSIVWAFVYLWYQLVSDNVSAIWASLHLDLVRVIVAPGGVR